MARYLVSYDLQEPTQNYDKVIGAIKRYPTWCYLMQSTWLIWTTETVVQVRDSLRRVMSINDKLFVVDTTGKSAAWHGLSDEQGDWVKTYQS
jgi:hypothetical protein